MSCESELAECRAELESHDRMLANAVNHTTVLQTALEAARAERDTALRDIENERKAGDALQRERDTALARIAELEAALQEAEWAAMGEDL